MQNTLEQREQDMCGGHLCPLEGDGQCIVERLSSTRQMSLSRQKYSPGGVGGRGGADGLVDGGVGGEAISNVDEVWEDTDGEGAGGLARGVRAG